MADGSSEDQMSRYLYKPGLKVVVGNTKHPHGKTALRHGPKASERFNGISVLDGEEVEILSVTDDYGSNEWTYVRRSTQEVGWLATRNLHLYGQGPPQPLAPGSYVLKRGMWATVGNVGEVGASAYLLDVCPPSDSRSDLDLWHRQGRSIADGNVVQVVQLSESTSEWVQVICVGNTEGWILTRNLHVPACVHQSSKYLYKPGLKVVVGNTKHPHGKTALRHGPKASERFNGISVLDGEEVEILSVTDEYGSNEWTYVRRSTQEVGWLATRNLHTYGQGLPEPLALGSYVLKRGMWATVGNVGEVGASAYLLDACPPSDSRNDLDLWHRQGQPIADEQVVQVAQIAETTSEWVQVKWHNCIGNAEKWILSRNLHVPADITVSQDTSATGDFATRVSLIRRIFMDCDADGNGVIDKSEFQGVFTRIGMTAKEVLLMFQQIDLDRNESIDIDEFLAWVFNTNCLDLIQKACTAAAPVKHRYDVEDIADAQYKPLLSFVDNPPHEDPLPCSHYLQEACAAAMPDVPLINRQVGEVSKIVQSIIAKPAVKEAMESYHVSKGMVFAIVMYTCDLCLVTLEAMERSQNFYYQLNVGLRSRRPEFLQSFHGYLYYLMTGLERLRPFAADCLYRGIDAFGAPRIEKEYYPGRKIHFSGFSSATPPDSVREAINFAKQSGDGGLLLRIRLQASGSRCRDIRALSAFPSESEILLLPNFPSIVVGRPSYDKDLKFQVLDLQEVSDAKIEIF